MSGPDDDPPIESAPEGSRCAAHPDRGALVTCPRCGDFVCIACWHQSVRRCHDCLMRDPGPPVPWADEQLGFGARLFGTLGHAFRPRHAAPTFARGEWTRGISFFVLTFVPLALLAGVIPYTFRLAFGPRWQVHAVGEPSQADLAVDVARAAGLGVGLTLVKLAALAAAYVLMVRLYGRHTEGHPERQVLLYRGWLLPVSTIVLGLTTWGLPVEPTSEMLWVVYIGYLAPIFLLMSNMSSAARMCAGVGPVAVLAVVLVAFGALIVVDEQVTQVIGAFMPSEETLRRATGASP